MRTRVAILSLGLSLIGLPVALADEPKPLPRSEAPTPLVAPQPPMVRQAAPGKPVPTVQPNPLSKVSVVDSRPQSVVFDVIDLVNSPVPMTVTSKLDSNPIMNANNLMKLIISTTQHETWVRGGGKGKIEYIPESYSLCVTNSPAVIADVKKMLEGLRRMRNQTVTIEVTVIEVPHSVGIQSNWPNAVGSKRMTPEEYKQAFAELNKDNNVRIVTKTKMLERDGHANYFQISQRSPKVQQADVKAQGPESGNVTQAGATKLDFDNVFKFCPSISMDGKSVYLDLDTTCTNLSNDIVLPDGQGKNAVVYSTFELKTTVIIPDDNTLVSHIGTRSVKQYTTQRLAIPYLRHLKLDYRTEQKESFEMYQIVTVHIKK